MIDRNLLKELRKHLSKKEISLIVGPRQAGKTTLMMILKAELEKKGCHTLFLNMDIERDLRFFFSQERLVRKMELELGQKKGYVFIDEIQRKENAGLFLKGIYDMNLPFKLIVSGSGSLELKEKIHESLVGRKRLFELNPLSFDEFVNFKTENRYASRLSEFFSLERERTSELLIEYLNFGGYPRVVTEETAKEKQSIIDEIFRSYLEKDISFLLRVKRIDAFRTLVSLLADQIGQLINLSEISNTIGVSLVTLKNYLWYGEGTFIFNRLLPYFSNIRKEITRSPKIYFFDLGLRNYCLGIFGIVPDPMGYGSVFENLICNMIRQRMQITGASLHFWRTKDKAEVDFIIKKGDRIIPLEVKYGKINKVSRSFRNFIERYNPSDAYIVTPDTNKMNQDEQLGILNNEHRMSNVEERMMKYRRR
jgi:predicted AAA+ superfamily ATPase